MDLRDIFRAVIVLLILVNTSYIRGFEVIESITTSYFIVVWILLGLAFVFLQVIRTKAVVVTKRWWLWCGLVGWLLVSFLYNILMRPKPGVAARFTAEMMLSIVLFGCLIYLLDKRILSVVYRGFVGCSAVAGLFLSVYPLFIGLKTVRRVGGYQVSGAVNNISQMIGVGIVIAVVGILYADSYRDARLELVSLPALFAGLVLTGSRAAVVGIGLAFLTLSVTSDRVTKRTVAVGAAVGGAVLTFLTVFYQFSGLYRFNPSFLLYSVENRFRVYTTALRQSGYTVQDIVFGGGMYRYSEIAQGIEDVTIIMYPHNYVISLLVHIGLPAAVLFTVLLILNARSLFYWTLSNSEEGDYVTISTLLALQVVVMYAFTSGRVTRTFPIWIMLAISEYLYVAHAIGYEGQLSLDGQRPDGDTGAIDTEISSIQ